VKSRPLFFLAVFVSYACGRRLLTFVHQEAIYIYFLLFVCVCVYVQVELFALVLSVASHVRFGG
jgi:hypothetical protein